MDNAADELELRRVLADTEDDVMATWSRYQLARSVMHKEVVFPKLDIASAVSQAIALEDEGIANQLSTAKVADVCTHKKANVLLTIGKFAVAASVMAVMLSTALLFNKDNSIATDTPYAQTGINEGVVVATNSQWVEQRLSSFMDRHEQQGILTIDAYDQTDTIDIK